MLIAVPCMVYVCRHVTKEELYGAILAVLKVANRTAFWFGSGVFILSS